MLNFGGLLGELIMWYTPMFFALLYLERPYTGIKKNYVIWAGIHGDHN